MKEDKIADTCMYFRQIIDLADLMLENNIFSMPNILTLRDLAQNGYEKLYSINDFEAKK